LLVLLAGTTWTLVDHQHRQEALPPFVGLRSSPTVRQCGWGSCAQGLCGSPRQDRRALGRTRRRRDDAAGWRDLLRLPNSSGRCASASGGCARDSCSRSLTENGARR
jgi:hypothetical protein